MQSSRDHNRNNSNGNNAATATTMAAAEGPSKRSFGIFSLMRKPKADPAARATPKTPPKLELHLPPPSPPPALVTDDNKGSEIPPAAARSRKVTKKASTDVDDELRKHLQREGFAFLAFTDLDRVAASHSTPPAAAAVAAGNGKPVAVSLVVDPVESSRRDGTLLRDAVQRLDKAGLEASRVGRHPSPSPSPPLPPSLVSPPPHPRPQPALSKPGRRSPETSAPERVQPPPASSPPPPQTQHKPTAPTKQKPAARAPPAVSPTVSPTTTPTPRIDTGAGVPNKDPTPSTVTVVGDATGVRSAISKRYGTVEPLAPTSGTPQPSASSSAVPTNGHLQAVDHNGSGGGIDRRVDRRNSHRRTERGTWNKSPTDSGKDLRMDASQATSSSTEGSSSAPPPGRAEGIPESSAMARFAQDASMHDVDPRRSGNYSNSNNSNQHPGPQPRRAPPPPDAIGRCSGNSSSRHHYHHPPHHPAAYAYGAGAGGRGGRRPRSYEAAEPPPAAANFENSRRSPSPPVDEVKTRSDSSPETSPEPSHAFSLPVPVMLPPDEYKTSPNELQRNCSQSHCWTVVSPNIHHRICCMVCQLDSADERWLCSYCALRFCSRCKSEFSHGQTFDQIVAKAEAEDWKAQQQQQPSSSSSSPARGAPERNIPWELACVMEAGGRLHGPAAVPRSSPPPWPRDYRRPPPPPSSRNRRGSPPGEQPYAYDYRPYDYRSYDHRYRHRSGKSSPHSSSYSPDRQYYDGIPSIHNHPPSSTESDQERRSRDSSRNGNRSKASSIYEDVPQAPSPVGYTDRRTKDARRRTPVSAEMVAPQAHKRCSLKGGAPSAAEQRRALLGGAPY